MVSHGYSDAVCKVFFTPDDDITSLLIAMIDAEEKFVYGAMYMFTDKKVAQAMINAHHRGVKVQLIIDQISMTSCGKGKFLKEHTVPLLVHRTEDFNPYSMALMHHKFFIFGCSTDQKSWVWTGSWNCTLRASKHNDENVLIISDDDVIAAYLDYFITLQNKLIKD